MKYTWVIYSYTLTQPEKECIVIDNIKVSCAKPEQNFFQNNQLNCTELYNEIEVKIKNGKRFSTQFILVKLR